MILRILKHRNQTKSMLEAFKMSTILLALSVSY